VNVNRSWKRFLAIGCSHGHLADPKALKTVLDFQERWKPHTSIHLGDYVDTAAFRTGAKGTKDETVSLESDLHAGVEFLKLYQPSIVLNGNHDIRLWGAQKAANAIVAECARRLVEDIKNALPKNCQFVETYDIRKSYVTLGDTKFLHGFMYSENAVRDHAEQFGKCVIAHLHKVVSVPGRRNDRARGYCVGYLGDEDKFGYALNRRATSQWSQGFAYGEYSDRECVVWLVERGTDGWRLPL